MCGQSIVQTACPNFINMGVDNIITDYPVKLAALIKERAALNDVEKFLLAAAEMLKR